MNNLEYDFDIDSLLDEVFNGNASKSLIFDEFTFMHDIPPIFKDLFNELIFNNNIKSLVIKGGRGSAKSTSAMQLIISLMLWKEYENRGFAFGGWKKEDTKETFNKIKLEIRRFKETIQEDFIINDSKKEITYKPNNTIIYFLPLTDFMEGGSKINNLNRLKSFNNIAFWVVDESVFITKNQLNIMVRTARENIDSVLNDFKNETDSINIFSNSKMIFLLNPSKPTGDDVVNYFINRNDGLVKHINILDLPKKYQSKELLKVMHSDKVAVDNGNMMIEEYNHIWLGQPQYDLHYNPFANINYVNYSLIKDKIENNKWVAYIDIAFGGGDNCVLMFGLKNLDEYLIIGYSFKESVTDRISFIKSKLEIFNNPVLYYESNNAKSMGKIFKDARIQSYSKHQKQNKEEKIARAFPFANKITFIKTSERENDICLNHLINYNPSSSKHDDEVDCLSEIILSYNFKKMNLGDYFKN